MGTREVYEEKLRTGNLYHHDPTISPGLGSPRCPRCLSLINPPASGEAEWTMTPVLHDAAAVAGSGTGAMLSAVHGFNTGIPFVQKHVKGPKWMQLLIGFFPVSIVKSVTSHPFCSSYQFLHYYYFQEQVLHLELTPFRNSLSYQSHHIIPHGHPHTMQFLKLHGMWRGPTHLIMYRKNPDELIFSSRNFL